jgi:hypothetical protein
VAQEEEHLPEALASFPSTGRTNKTKQNIPKYPVTSYPNSSTKIKLMTIDLILQESNISHVQLFTITQNIFEVKYILDHLS